ncbi:helix-turn-helix transcriptional regulator [Cyanobacteria bacterium FACHB-DQ100]|nr:helix-turn-helix transcriptional regulator [Cyanobacteria bacterium FACHB-DQ100]
MRIRQIRETEVSGLGERIKQARLDIAATKSLEEICREVGVSRTYWYDLEKETLKGTLAIENLRKIESALGIDFGVSFDELAEAEVKANG